MSNISKADMASIIAGVVSAFNGAAPATVAPSPKARKAPKTGDASATFTAAQSPVKPDYIELYFSAKPVAAITADLKTRGFRFSTVRGAHWYGPKASAPALALAQLR